MPRADGREQADIKRADRNAGFERLYELLDWLCLEVSTTAGCCISARRRGIRAPGQRMIYNSADLPARCRKSLSYRRGGAPVREFFPQVDITVQSRRRRRGVTGRRRCRRSTV